MNSTRPSIKRVPPIYVTLFWKTIHLGPLANFLYYSYNEALSGYLPHMEECTIQKNNRLLY